MMHFLLQIPATAPTTQASGITIEQVGLYSGLATAIVLAVGALIKLAIGQFSDIKKLWKEVAKQGGNIQAIAQAATKIDTPANDVVDPTTAAKIRNIVMEQPKP